MAVMRAFFVYGLVFTRKELQYKQNIKIKNLERDS